MTIRNLTRKAKLVAVLVVRQLHMVCFVWVLFVWVCLFVFVCLELLELNIIVFHNVSILFHF